MPDHAPTYPIAPLWRRLVALMYDGFIVLAISLIYGTVVNVAFVNLTNTQLNEDYTPVVGGPLYLLGWYLSIALFYAYFWHRGGQTVGMKAWKIKVLSLQSNSTASWSSCFLRAAIGPISFFSLLAGYFWKWFDKDGHCLHDKLSGTKVVVVPKGE